MGASVGIGTWGLWRDAHLRFSIHNVFYGVLNRSARAHMRPERFNECAGLLLTHLWGHPH